MQVVKRLFITVLIGICVINYVEASSRIVSNKVNGSILVGRNMDWFESMATKLWILPQGMKRNGLVGENSLQWISQYGSVVAVGYDAVTVDGMNEKGLSAALLYLPESDFGKRDIKQAGLSSSLLAQYFLDNYASVNEALNDFARKPFQPVAVSIGNKGKMKGTAYLALTDKTGDNAIIEYINGKPQIYHDKDYTVLTDAPFFLHQVASLKQYQSFGGEKTLPGTNEAEDRFVRAAYYLKNIPETDHPREAVTALLAIMRNVAQPMLANDHQAFVFSTLWMTVADLTNNRYHYGSTHGLSIIWADLDEMDFSKKASPKVLNLADYIQYGGDVTDLFKPTKMFDFLAVDSVDNTESTKSN